MGWIVYFIVFVSIIALGSKLYVKEESDNNKGKMINGLITMALLLGATIAAVWVTNELGFSLGGYSSSDEPQYRPGIGPFEW